MGQKIKASVATPKNGIATALIAVQPVITAWFEQFSNKPEPKDAIVTLPNTIRSFMPWTVALSETDMTE